MCVKSRPSICHDLSQQCFTIQKSIFKDLKLHIISSTLCSIILILRSRLIYSILGWSGAFSVTTDARTHSFFLCASKKLLSSASSLIDTASLKVATHQVPWSEIYIPIFHNQILYYLTLLNSWFDTLASPTTPGPVQLLHGPWAPACDSFTLSP